MDCLTKWPEIYTIANQEASILADAMFDQLQKLLFPDGAAQRPRPEIRIQANAGDPGATGGQQNWNNTTTPAVRRNGGTIREDFAAWSKEVISNQTLKDLIVTFSEFFSSKAIKEAPYALQYTKLVKYSGEQDWLFHDTKVQSLQV